MVNKMKPKKRGSFGAPTISLIIAAVGLVIFAVLALQNSLNEKRLAEKSAESVKNYYALSAKAEEVIAKIDYICACSNTAFPMEDISVLESVTRVTKAQDTENGFLIDIYVLSDTGDSAIDAEILYDRNEGRYDIKKWKSIHITNTEADGFIF